MRISPRTLTFTSLVMVVSCGSAMVAPKASETTRARSLVINVQKLLGPDVSGWMGDASGTGEFYCNDTNSEQQYDVGIIGMPTVSQLALGARLASSGARSDGFIFYLYSRGTDWHDGANTSDGYNVAVSYDSDGKVYLSVAAPC
jgi:hypothetical protein